MYLKIPCKRCGVGIIVDIDARYVKRYCEECRRELHQINNTTVERVCVECGEVFKVKRAVEDKYSKCPKCRAKGTPTTRDSKITECINCGKEMVVPRRSKREYCQKCRREHMREVMKGRNRVPRALRMELKGLNERLDRFYSERYLGQIVRKKMPGARGVLLRRVYEKVPDFETVALAVEQALEGTTKIYAYKRPEVIIQEYNNTFALIGRFLVQ